MLTILGSVLGFGTSFLPKVLDLFQDRQDKKHELAMMAQSHQNRLEIAETQAEAISTQARYGHDAQITIKSGWFMAAFSASFRPWSSHTLWLLFIATKAAMLAVAVLEAWLIYEIAVKAGGFAQGYLAGADHLAKALLKIWDEPTTALLATIVSYWYGDRTRKHAFGK